MGWLVVTVVACCLLLLVGCYCCCWLLGLRVGHRCCKYCYPTETKILISIASLVCICHVPVPLPHQYPKLLLHQHPKLLLHQYYSSYPPNLVITPLSLRYGITCSGFVDWPGRRVHPGGIQIHGSVSDTRCRYRCRCRHRCR